MKTQRNSGPVVCQDSCKTRFHSSDGKNNPEATPVEVVRVGRGCVCVCACVWGGGALWVTKQEKASIMDYDCHKKG